MPKKYAIVLAGGSGLRMGMGLPKQFLPLGEKTILGWTVSAFERHEGIQSIVVVSPADHLAALKSILEKSCSDKSIDIVTGGATRRESSWNGITARDFSDDDIVFIHDAARPFVDRGIIDRCAMAAEKHGAAAAYVKAIDTITEIIGGKVVSIPPRNNLYYAQTPQAFTFAVIRRAHEEARSRGIDATDDVSMVLAAGIGVEAVEGSYRNIKITTQDDYNYACYLAEIGALEE